MIYRPNRMCFRILQGLIILTPLPFGSAPEPFATLFFLILVIWMAVAWPDAREEIPLPGGKWLGLLVLTLPLLVALQLVPLPRGWVAALHPGALPLLESLPMSVGDWLTLSMAPGITMVALPRMMVLALFFLTVLRLPVGRREVRGLVNALLVSGGIQAVIGLARMLLPGRNFFLFFHPIQNPLPGVQLTGTFAENAQAALLLGMAFFAGLGLWAAEAGLFSSRGPRLQGLREWVLPGQIRWRHFLLSGGCLVGFFLARSRDTRWLLIGSSAVVFVLWLYTQFTPQRRHAWRWIFLVATGLALIMGVLHVKPQFQDQATGEKVLVRPERALKKMVRDFPLLGSGWDTFSLAGPDYLRRPKIQLSHVRNEWKQVAVEGGLVFVGVLAAVFLIFLFGLWHRWIACTDRWDRAASAGLMAAALLTWGATWFHYPLRIPSLLFITLLAMGLSARLVAEQRRR